MIKSEWDKLHEFGWRFEYDRDTRCISAEHAKGERMTVALVSDTVTQLMANQLGACLEDMLNGGDVELRWTHDIEGGASHIADVRDANGKAIPAVFKFNRDTGLVQRRLKDGGRIEETHPAPLTYKVFGMAEE